MATPRSFITMKLTVLMLINLIAGIAVLPLQQVLGEEPAPPKKSECELKLASNKSAYLIGEPIYITVSFLYQDTQEWVFSRPPRLDLRFSGDDLKILLRQEDEGGELHLNGRAKWRSDHPPLLREFRLAPEEKVEVTSVLQAACMPPPYQNADMGPGKYNLRVVSRFGSKVEGASDVAFAVVTPKALASIKTTVTFEEIGEARPCTVSIVCAPQKEPEVQLRDLYLTVVRVGSKESEKQTVLFLPLGLGIGSEVPQLEISKDGSLYVLFAQTPGWYTHLIVPRESLDVTLRQRTRGDTSKNKPISIEFITHHKVLLKKSENGQVMIEKTPLVEPPGRKLIDY